MTKKSTTKGMTENVDKTSHNKTDIQLKATDDALGYTTTKIIRLLKESGMTRYALAKKASIPYTSLNNIIARGTEPSYTLLSKICKAFGISVSEFYADATEVKAWRDAITEDERQLLAKYALLSDYSKGYLAKTIEVLIENDKESNGNSGSKNVEE